MKRLHQEEDSEHQLSADDDLLCCRTFVQSVGCQTNIQNVAKGLEDNQQTEDNQLLRNEIIGLKACCIQSSPPFEDFKEN